MDPFYTLVVRAGLSVIFVTGYGATLFIVLQPGIEISPAAEKLALIVLGALTTCVVGVFNFWFGTSQGSAEKTIAMLNRQ